MAELADALDSGSVTSVNALTTVTSPASETLLRVKIKGKTQYAGMAELADALDSGSSGGNFVEVQVLLPAPPKALKTLRFRGFFLSFFLGRHITTVHHLGVCVCLFCLTFS